MAFQYINFRNHIHDLEVRRPALIIRVDESNSFLHCSEFKCSAANKNVGTRERLSWFKFHGRPSA